MAARNQFLQMASQRPAAGERAAERPGGRAAVPTRHRCRRRPCRCGLSMGDVNDTLAVAWGGRYIDDFIDRGRIKHVIVQADAPFRMVPEDFGRWYVRNGQSAHGLGRLVRELALGVRLAAPRALQRRGGDGNQRPGGAGREFRRGDDEMEKLVARLPSGFSVEFTGQSYEERAAGAQTPMLYALSLIVVFLCLAALYESWSIPTAILLAVPLGVIGAVLATQCARPRARHLFPGGDADDDRTCLEERDPDRRVRQGECRSRHARDRGHAARGARPPAPDPDDLARLRLRRAAAGAWPPAPVPARSARSAPACSAAWWPAPSSASSSFRCSSWWCSACFTACRTRIPPAAPAGAPPGESA